MKIENNVPLARYSTMKIGGEAKHLTHVTTEDELVEAIKWAKEKRLRFRVIGSGSNIVFTDEGYDGLIIIMDIKGISHEGTTITAKAGEIWDDLVKYSTDLGLSGIETLAAIPGTVGAAPVQNIGAYGQELADTFTHLLAYDTKLEKIVEMDRGDCKFGYRTSKFKSNHPEFEAGRYVILEITLELKKEHLSPPFYTTLQAYIDEHNITDFSPASIRQIVTKWRHIYLPDPSNVPSNGSFFANPVISGDRLERIKSQHPELANTDKDWFWEKDGKYKVAAGRLAEIAGLKDWHDKETGMATWKNQALVLVNEDAKAYSDLESFKNKYLDKIKTEYGLELEQEPEIVS